MIGFLRMVLGGVLGVAIATLAQSQPVEPGIRSLEGFTYRVMLPPTELFLPDPLKPELKKESKVLSRLVPSDLCLSPDGKYVGTSFLDPWANLEVWEASTGKKIWEAPDFQGYLTYTPNGKLVVGGTRFGGEIRGFQAKDGMEKFRFPSGTKILMGIKPMPDSKGLIVSGLDGQIIHLNLETQKVEKVLRGPSTKPAKDDFPVRAFTMDISPDGKVLAIGNQVPMTTPNRKGYGNVTLLDIATGKPIRQFLEDAEDVYSLAFSPDGKSLAVNYITFNERRLPERWLIETVDCQTGAKLKEYSLGPSGELAFSPDGRLLFGIKGPYFYAWDVRTGYLRRRLKDPFGFAKKIVISPKGIAAATFSDDKNSALIWRGQTGSGKQVFWGSSDLEKIVQEMGASLSEEELEQSLRSKSIEKLDLAAYDLARSPNQAVSELEKRLTIPGGIKNNLFGGLAVEILESLGERELLELAAKHKHETTATEAKAALKRLAEKKKASK